jgi:rare lipoprotein A
MRARQPACLLLSLAVLITFTGGCRKKKTVGVPLPAPAPVAGSVEEGIASWYGHPYHGRRAANGEVYDMNELTAAHRTLPLETVVEVLSKSNGKSVTVRVTDRGPFVEGRIIDLSLAAARRIDMVGRGIAPVRVRVLRVPSGTGLGGTFAVQAGAFRERANAERLREALERRYGNVRLVRREGNPDLWRVLVGKQDSIEGAEVLARELNQEGGGAFVVRLDGDM